MIAANDYPYETAKEVERSRGAVNLVSLEVERQLEVVVDDSGDVVCFAGVVEGLWGQQRRQGVYQTFVYCHQMVRKRDRREKTKRLT